MFIVLAYAAVGLIAHHYAKIFRTIAVRDWFQKPKSAKRPLFTAVHFILDPIAAIAFWHAIIMIFTNQLTPTIWEVILLGGGNTVTGVYVFVVMVKIKKLILEGVLPGRMR